MHGTQLAEETCEATDFSRSRSGENASSSERRANATVNGENRYGSAGVLLFRSMPFLLLLLLLLANNREEKKIAENSGSISVTKQFVDMSIKQTGKSLALSPNVSIPQREKTCVALEPSESFSTRSRDVCVLYIFVYNHRFFFCVFLPLCLCLLNSIVCKSIGGK